MSHVGSIQRTVEGRPRRGLFFEVKRPEYLASFSSAVDKNTWESTSTPSFHFTRNPLPLKTRSYPRGAISPCVRLSARSQQIDNREDQTL
jgi:hypothetical protein